MPRPRADVNRSSGVVPSVAVLAILGMTAWYALRQSAEVAPGRVELSRLSPRRLQTAVALNGVAGGATAGQETLAAVGDRNAPPPDRPAVRVSSATAYGLCPLPDVGVARDDPARPPPAIRITGVTSSRPSDREEATADALRQARDKLAEVFAALRSPIHEVPTEEELWEEYVEKPVVEKAATEAEKAAWREAKLDADRVWKVLTVSVSEQQLRQLRARQRLHDLSRWAVAALALLAIAYGVLRAEERSQGYFTWLWVGLGAALVGGVVTLAIVL